VTVNYEKKSILFFFVLIASTCKAQYDDYLKSIVGKSTIFKKVKGEFVVKGFKKVKDKNGERQINYSYEFNKLPMTLGYYYPTLSSDSSCNYFVINKAKVSMRGLYPSDFACDLDVTSFAVYKGRYENKNYILITAINNGSGSSTTSVICNLFDVTNLNKIKYFALWSKFGSASCFNDFNKDGKLDFLQIRNLKGDPSKLKMTIESLQDGMFRPYQQDQFYITLSLLHNGYKVLKKKGFK
jgi:hypothetical protein